MKIYLSTALLFLLFQTHQAQEHGESQLGAWYMYAGTHRITDKLSMNSGIQLWDYEPTNNFNLFLIITGVEYTFNPYITTTVGYGYATIDGSFENIPNENVTREHRLYEQLRFKSIIWKLQVDHRYRIEHRFLNDAITTNLKHRNRYRLQLTLPISDTFFVNVYDELFWHFDKAIFNQNRLYAAFGTCISPQIKLRFGYLKHHFRNRSYDRLQVSIDIKTDLRKHKKTTVANFDNNNTSDIHELQSD